jgi:protoporphyrinogen/coproporphyrinogen III oxidase
VEKVDVAIVGGGITGLAAAFRIVKRFPNATVVVLESAPVAGGKLGSARVAGITIDTAADAFLARVEGAVELATELGLQDNLIAPSTGQAAVLTHGALRNLPTGLVLGVPTDIDALSASGILSSDGLRAAAADATTARPLSAADRSVATAVGQHLGAEVVDRLVDPLLGGISAAHCADLSVMAAAPQIGRAAQEPHLMAALIDQQASAHRGQIGVTEERPVFLAPRAGVHHLVSTLTNILGDVLRTGIEVRRISQIAGGSWAVHTSLGEFRSDHVIVTTPAPVSSRILSEFPGPAAILGGIRYASVALLVMAYRLADVSLPDGSGLLVPRPEKRLVTAASWWNHKWPHLQDGTHTLIRASVGRIDDTRFQSLSDADLIAGVHADLSNMTGIELTGAPVDVNVARWTNSFAQYDVGHLDRIEQLQAVLPPRLHLAGAALRGVGLPACIRSANEAAAQVGGELQNSPAKDG